MYVIDRPDHAWRLVCHPYYAKYAKPGDRIAFAHIDVNISELIKSGRGGNMIQGSISLNDESLNCTINLPGMHNHIYRWWVKVLERKSQKSGFVSHITNRMFNEDHKEELDFSKREDVRVIIPQLFHESLEPVTAIRRTMLPSYIALGENHETLEAIEVCT